jgi:hypothetical protein
MKPNVSAHDNRLARPAESLALHALGDDRRFSRDGRGDAHRAQCADAGRLRRLGPSIPASCRHPAGGLVSGSLPLPSSSDSPSPGVATVLKGKDTRKFLVPPVRADLTQDGTPELAGVLLALLGGVSWPELILVYLPGPKLLGYIDVGRVTPAEHSDVLSMEPDGDDLQVTWRSYEGCCSDMRKHSGTVHWNGSRLVMRNVT